MHATHFDYDIIAWPAPINAEDADDGGIRGELSLLGFVLSGPFICKVEPGFDWRIT